MPFDTHKVSCIFNQIVLFVQFSYKVITLKEDFTLDCYIVIIPCCFCTFFLIFLFGFILGEQTSRASQYQLSSWLTNFVLLDLIGEKNQSCSINIWLICAKNQVSIQFYQEKKNNKREK